MKTYRAFGEGAILIEWPSGISEQLLLEIISLQKRLEEVLHEKIIETQNTYHSLAVYFDPEKIKFKRMVAEIKEAEKGITTRTWGQVQHWKLPLCYDRHFGIDLNEIARVKNLSIADIIRIHSSTDYRVYFTGFLPGFLYLGGLNEKLAMPRKSTPRPLIRKGAVAIGGSQTGIYPQESPGGWNIIGNCPQTLFDPDTDPPCRIKAGDLVQFLPISREEYNNLSGL